MATQNYPRIIDEKNKYFGFLDESKLVDHNDKISIYDLKEIVKKAILDANKKSSRAILNISENVLENDLEKIYKKEGKELFRYFVKYCGDPAATANDCLGQNFSKVAIEQFRNRTIQKERMNSGWRYQFIARDAAIKSRRFDSLSDIGTSEADFNAIVRRKDNKDVINIYVSIKNRSNTMGGQDWPKAIYALEEVAKSDKNRSGAYLCVFGIAMEKGERQIRKKGNTKQPYSNNTEVWLSNFFWPFFSNFTYEEIIKTVLEVMVTLKVKSSIEFQVPQELIFSFGEICKEHNLLDENGNFHDPYRLVELFVRKGI